MLAAVGTVGERREIRRAANSVEFIFIFRKSLRVIRSTGSAIGELDNGAKIFRCDSGKVPGTQQFENLIDRLLSVRCRLTPKIQLRDLRRDLARLS
jgi:hypothetical protein